VRLAKPQALWERSEIEEALRPFLEGRSVWPGFPEFQQAGLALLHAQLQRRGRTSGWAREVGMPYKGPRRFSQRWTDAEIRRQLGAYLAGKTTWPSWSQFRADGQEPLRHAVRWRGGAEHWAAEFGVELLRSQHTPAYWTTARLRRELAEFTKGRTDWPARREFEAAGRLVLCKRINEKRLRRRLADELGLQLPRGKRRSLPGGRIRRSPPHSTRC
jgi:hypothetical protein